jgi:hypothetical protein
LISQFRKVTFVYIQKALFELEIEDFVARHNSYHNQI